MLTHQACLRLGPVVDDRITVRLFDGKGKRNGNFTAALLLSVFYPVLLDTPRVLPEIKNEEASERFDYVLEAAG